MPVSDTDSTSSLPRTASWTTAARTTICAPASVNFAALCNRLESTWTKRVGSHPEHDSRVRELHRQVRPCRVDADAIRFDGAVDEIVKNGQRSLQVNLA